MFPLTPGLIFASWEGPCHFHQRALLCVMCCGPCSLCCVSAGCLQPRAPQRLSCACSSRFVLLVVHCRVTIFRASLRFPAVSRYMFLQIRVTQQHFCLANRLLRLGGISRKTLLDQRPRLFRGIVGNTSESRSG